MIKERCLSMQVTGIIAEYNPFHNGHLHHIKETRAMREGFILVALSGDFVQRGEVAMFSKHLRARWALEHGADMVIALPSVYSLASARRFASGGVGLLAATGIVNALSFGSECGELSRLQAIALAPEDADMRAALRTGLARGLSYPAAVAAATGALGANDMLGVEYLRALSRLNKGITPFCVRRTGALHDAALDTQSKSASASAVRQAILSGNAASTAPYLPTDVYDALQQNPPRLPERLSDAVLYALRRMSKAQLAALPDVNEGLENVLYREARRAADYTAFLFGCKTRRYTLSRLRRISMCALLGIEREDLDRTPYIRVLGVRREARDLLNALYAHARVPVVTRFAEAAALPADAGRLHAIDLLASEVACLASCTPAVFDYAGRLPIV